MEELSSFLFDPLSKGVYYAKFEIDLSKINLLYNYLDETLFEGKSILLKQLVSDIEVFSSEKKYDDLFDMGIKMIYYINKDKENDYMKYVNSIKSEKPLIENNIIFSVRLHPMLLDSLNITKKKIKKDFDKFSHYFYMDEENYVLKDIFKPHLNKDNEDCTFIISRIILQYKIKIIEVLTITKNSLEIFENFIKSIPFLGNNIKIIKREKIHISDHSLKLYPLAVKQWLSKKDAYYLPENINELLNNSLNYYYNKEWRMSIILNSIIVELILSDMYENVFQKYAPDVPLGVLFNSIKHTLPNNLKKDIELLNESRIEAVHKSKIPLSEKEAIISLHGATSLAIWNYKKDN